MLLKTVNNCKKGLKRAQKGKEGKQQNGLKPNKKAAFGVNAAFSESYSAVSGRHSPAGLRTTQILSTKAINTESPPTFFRILAGEGGPDGTRTRDPMRDRHVF